MSVDRKDDRRDDRRDGDDSFTQVYVAKLHHRTKESDLQEAFSKFGKIKDLSIKHTYAFINFEDHTAADNAIKEMNGKTFVNGEELVVEISGRGKITN
jgi:arginine/serine-rich splicing factor 7